MIARLQGHYVYRERHRRSYYYRSRENAGRRWTDDQIRRALKLTQERFDQCLRAHRVLIGPHWDHNSVQEAFNAFVTKNKRWPRMTDWDEWWENGLPPRSTACYHAGFLSQGSLHRSYCAKRTSLSKTLTAQMVLSIRNLTVRRDVMTRIGIENIVNAGGGKRIQQDDFGTLWKLPTDSRDPYVIYVEVVNSSPRINEKTGKVVKDQRGKPVYDHFFLRVPHTCRTAREAVAWTFELPADDFTGFVAQS